MALKCRKCIDYFTLERRILEAICDLKGKNEGFSHAVLKSSMCELMREIGRNWDKKSVDYSIETEAHVEGIGKVDVVASIGDATIAIECGTTNPKKIGASKKRFDIVLHVPYSYTPDLYHLDRAELDHQVMVVNVFKGLEKRGLDTVKGKAICLEDGNCSLPSGRDGFPEEAIQIASGHSEEEHAN